jgi:cytochrome c biogenesis protein CcmG, thiol:disulfide interchange protein DsbE
MSSSASTDLLTGPPGRRPGRRRVLSLVVGVVLAVGVWVGLTSFTAPGPTKAHPFSLPRLGGGPPVRVPVVGEGAREAVVVTFFASWCGPCHRELPSVARVARQAEAAGDKVQFIGVDDNDAPASGLAFAHRSGVTFPVGRDSLSLVAPTYGIPGNPATVFIDAAGNVTRTVLGPVAPATLEAEIARLDGT